MNKPDFIHYESASDEGAQITRALRYNQAMRACGGSRVKELIPIAESVEPAAGHLLDMMSGNGFVSRFLGAGFDVVHSLDHNPPSSLAFSNGSIFLQYDAALPDLAKMVKFRYDRIVSLAGFHHLIPHDTGPGLPSSQIHAYRVRCLSQWFDLLVQGGRLVIGDVPATNQPALSAAPPSAVLCFPDLQKALTDLPRIPVEDVHNADPEPACFFDELVAMESITPHVAVFETEASLALLLEDAGFSNVKTSVHYTPWLFSDSQEAAWFMHHLFGIGKETFEEPSDLPLDLMDHLLAAADRFLGCGSIQSGGFWIGWKLLYASGEKRL